MEQYGLGRLYVPDERDKRFPMRLALKKLEPEPLNKFWYIQDKLLGDQGDSPHCVGYSWKHWLHAAPLRTKNAPDPYLIYQEAQKVDEWPGEDYDGTSVRGGAKAMMDRGHIESYVWAYDIEELRKFVLLKGTVVMGTTWTDAMFHPDKKGWIYPMGQSVGGHAYLCIGYSSKKKSFRFINSWGPYWGHKGRFWMHEDDVQILLDDFGEACAALEQKIEPLTS